MQGAIFFNARLVEANLAFANLHGADLLRAQLQGADLGQAQLQGAELREAQLQGANLGYAQLQGADLGGGAQLQGADLGRAQLQGANLGYAQLQGANLGYAQLQGADLSLAQLQGADLSLAQLQGADLSSTDMADATIDGTFVFWTNVADADLSTTAVRSVRADPVKASEITEVTPLTAPDVDGWIAAATQFAPESDNAKIAARFARLKPDFHDDLRQPSWSGIEEASRALDPNRARHRQRLAKILGDLACDPSHAPDVAQELTTWNGYPDSSRLADLGDQLDMVRARMEEGRKNSEKCRGVVGFDEEDWRLLEAIEPAQTQSAASSQP